MSDHIRFILLIAIFVTCAYGQYRSNLNYLDKFNHAVMDNLGKYHFYWRIDDDAHELHLEMHVQTQGWIGIGFSPNGGMQGADIVVAGVNVNDNNQPYLYDMHAESNSKPISDSQQDYELILSRENGTHTVIGMKRKWITCDEFDWKITNDTMRIIWAMGREDALSPQSFNKHAYESRGTRSIILTNPKDKHEGEKMPPDVKPWDLTVKNVNIPSDYHTLYHCTIFKAPQGINKHHVVKYEPVISPGSEKYLHHILVYHCLYNMEKWVGKAEPCFNREQTKNSAMYKCTSRYLAGWAVGAGPVTWTPDYLGLPIFEEGASPYFLLEVHYDNSDYHQNIVDNSGMRLWITEKLKPVEIGSLITGMGTNAQSIIIPPGLDSFKVRTICTPKCTQEFPKEGLTVINVFLHEHVSGKAVRVHHYRDGVELAPLAEDNHYDFNYQMQRPIVPARKILPNDTLIVECEYDTSNPSIKEPVFGGFTTKQEMCFVFIDYYPKAKKSPTMCFGGPVPESYIQAMGAEKVEGIDRSKLTKDGYFVKGPYGNNITMKEYAIQYPWTKQEGKDFERKIEDGGYWEMCGFKSGEDMPKIEEDIEDEFREIEKVDYTFKVHKTLPKPRIPFREMDVCGFENDVQFNNLGVSKSGYNSRNRNSHGNSGNSGNLGVLQQRPVNINDQRQNYQGNPQPNYGNQGNGNYYPPINQGNTERGVNYNGANIASSYGIGENGGNGRNQNRYGNSSNYQRGNYENENNMNQYGNRNDRQDGNYANGNGYNNRESDAYGNTGSRNSYGSNDGGYENRNGNENANMNNGNSAGNNKYANNNRYGNTIGASTSQNGNYQSGNYATENNRDKYSNGNDGQENMRTDINDRNQNQYGNENNGENNSNGVNNYGNNDRNNNQGNSNGDQQQNRNENNNDDNMIKSKDGQDLYSSNSNGDNSENDSKMYGNSNWDTYGNGASMQGNNGGEQQRNSANKDENSQQNSNLIYDSSLKNDSVFNSGNRNNSLPYAEQIDPNFTPISDEMTHSLPMDPQGDFWLYWTVNDPMKEIMFEVHVKTKGWAAIGFSPNGNMKSADIITFWIDEKNSALHLQDRYSEGDGLPKIDRTNNIVVEGGMRDGDKLIARFRRLLVTCDTEDNHIEDATMRIIYAFDDAVPKDEDDLRKHQARNRGSRSTYLLGEPERYEHVAAAGETAAELERDADVSTQTFLADHVQLPHDHHTLYWCQIFELPHKEKEHIIRYEPVIQSGNEAHVHHMILYGCDKDMSEYVGQAEPCFDNKNGNRDNSSAMYACSQKFVAGWAVGGMAHILPEDLGMPMYGSGYKYAMLEMHYDNSDYANDVVDSSGLKMYTTKKLRPTEVGGLVFGNPISQIIPPQQNIFVTYSYCTADCTQNIPTEGITVFAGLLHTHLAGVGVRLRHIRNGIELKPLMEDGHYDFNFQQMRTRTKPTKIMPGDELIMECYYDTSQRQETTFGGYATQDEMCVGYLEYYPKIERFYGCMSVMDARERMDIFEAKVANDWPLQIRDENTGENVTMRKWVKENVNWDGKSRYDSYLELIHDMLRFGKAKELQNIERDGKHWLICMKGEDANDNQKDSNSEQNNNNMNEEDMNNKYDEDPKEIDEDMKFTMGGPKIVRYYKKQRTCPIDLTKASVFEQFDDMLQKDGRLENNREYSPEGDENVAQRIFSNMLLRVVCMLSIILFFVT